jgi:hypothetical protein
VPGQPIGSPHRLSQGSGHLLEHLVAHTMPETVVNLLEVVNIDHQAGQRDVVDSSKLSIRFEPFRFLPPVTQAGERVGLRCAHRLGPRPLQLDQPPHQPTGGGTGLRRQHRLRTQPNAAIARTLQQSAISVFASRKAERHHLLAPGLAKAPQRLPPGHEALGR